MKKLTLSVAAGLVLLSLPGVANAHPPHPHSCRPRVARYCPDLHSGRGTARICAARLHISEHQFCHGHLAPPHHVAAHQPGYAPPPGR